MKLPTGNIFWLNIFSLQKRKNKSVCVTSRSKSVIHVMIYERGKQERAKRSYRPNEMQKVMKWNEIIDDIVEVGEGERVGA